MSFYSIYWKVSFIYYATQNSMPSYPFSPAKKCFDSNDWKCHLLIMWHKLHSFLPTSFLSVENCFNSIYWKVSLLITPHKIPCFLILFPLLRSSSIQIIERCHLLITPLKIPGFLILFHLLWNESIQIIEDVIH